MTTATPSTNRRPAPLPPVIEHPTARKTRLEREDGRLKTPLDVRGGGGGGPEENDTRRPLPNEEGDDVVRRATSTASSRRSVASRRRSSSGASLEQPRRQQQQRRHSPIAEEKGEEVRVRVPALDMRAQAAEAALQRARGGVENKANDASRLLGSAQSSRIASEAASARLELDEIESLVKEKVRNNYYEMRKLFMANDPEQKGNVTRDALLRIIASAIGRPVSFSQLVQLFQRLGLRRDAQMLGFAEFFAAVRDEPDGEYPNWMDPIQRQRQARPRLSAEEVHARLADRMRNKGFADIADAFPQFADNVDGANGRLLKPELRSALAKMLLPMDDDEFERLWRIFDPRDTGRVKFETMLRKLGVRPTQDGSDQASDKAGKQSRQLLKTETDRQRSLTIEAWLKDKFREGFQRLKASFEARDSRRTGLVSHEDFLAVLRENSLSLEKLHLAEFLARCAVTHTKAGVMYRDFLHRFQDRSEAGMTHKIMANPHHAQEPDDVSRGLSSVERQLMNMFQRDFLSLLSAFQKIDRHGRNAISQEEFRAVMESRFGFELTDAQFKEFVDKLPLNSEGLVRYDVFMRQFDTKGMAPSLFKSVRGGGRDDQSESSTASVGDEDDLAEEEPYDPNKRSVADTRRCIRDLLHRQFQDVETAFYEMDSFNGSRLTQEMMHQLLNRFIKPEVTRGEIRDLWKTFYLRDREALDYQEFLRAFIFNPLTAAYPNAKLFPPKKGDSDLMMRSRKVNSDASMLEDGLRAKIDFLWDRLRDEFVDMDPYGTGCVSREEFQEVLKELAIQLTDYELNRLTEKFTQKSDGRVNYIELLRPFAYKRQQASRRQHIVEVLTHRHQQAEPSTSSLQQQKQQQPQPQQQQQQQKQPIENGATKGLKQLATKLNALSDDGRKQLLRQLAKSDQKHDGLMSLAEFRSTLQQSARIGLEEEEAFQLMSRFDADLSGKLPYKRVLRELLQQKMPAKRKKNK